MKKARCRSPGTGLFFNQRRCLLAQHLTDGRVLEQAGQRIDVYIKTTNALTLFNYSYTHCMNLQQHHIPCKPKASPVLVDSTDE
jgi:hypothetical protein